MAGLMKHEPRGEVGELFSRFDHMFEEWAKMLPFRAVAFPHWPETEDLIRVEEYREDGTLVVRADLPGIDPDKDVELTVSDGMLYIRAERREEEKREDQGYLRRELRYGSLSRALPLPEGILAAPAAGYWPRQLEYPHARDLGSTEAGHSRRRRLLAVADGPGHIGTSGSDQGFAPG